MIFGVGTDIIEIERIKRACEKESFMNKIFTEKEKEYLAEKNFKSETLAGIFASKEAVVKALRVGFSQIKAVDIEVLHDGKCAPYVVFYGSAINFALENKITKVSLSISHCKDYAISVAIAEVD